MLQRTSADVSAVRKVHMVAAFLYSIAGGMLAILATGRIEQIAWRFLRFVGFLVLALSCVVLVDTHRAPASTLPAPFPWTWGLGLALAAASVVVVFGAPIAEGHRVTFKLVCGCGGAAGLAAACGTTVTGLSDGTGRAWSFNLATTMVILSQVLAGLLLGSITIAWLLGHAYLTATKMTIAPLRHFSRMLSWAVAIRVVFLLVSLVLACTTANDASPLHGATATILTRLEHAWLIVVLRVGVGLAAVGLFAYMVADCVRLRATQSATGILYFASVFAYAGELAGQQLVRELHWPI